MSNNCISLPNAYKYNYSIIDGTEIFQKMFHTKYEALDCGTF